MLQIRFDPNVPGNVFQLVGPPLERAASEWKGLGEAFVYCVPDPRGARELMIRVSTLRSVVPVLFRLDTLRPDDLERVVRGALKRGDL